MNTVTLDIGGLEDGLAAFQDAWSTGKSETGARISFSSPELLWSVLTAERWAVLRTMTGRGPMSIGGADRANAEALAAAGLLRSLPDGRFEFPYDAVHVDFMLRAA